MNILLTGATGFVGSAFLKTALAHGHRVAALVRPETCAARTLPQHENLLWVPGTLAEAPFDRLAAFAPETCVHAAWIATPGVYLEAPENADWLRWSLAFVRQARALAGVRRVVGLGTCIEYQIAPTGREPLREESTPLAPSSFYARCKNELRLRLEEEAGHGDFSFCWGRVFYPYGPGEHPERLCSVLIRRLLRQEKIVLKTPDSMKDYIYIDDLASALLAVTESDYHGAVNLGTGEGSSVGKIADILAERLGGKDLVERAEPPAEDPLAYVVADIHRLRGLGWMQKQKPRDGLAKLVLSLRNKPA